MVRCIFRKRRLLKPPRIKSKTGCPEVDLLTEFHCIFFRLEHKLYFNQFYLPVFGLLQTNVEKLLNNKCFKKTDSGVTFFIHERTAKII